MVEHNAASPVVKDLARYRERTACGTLDFVVVSKSFSARFIQR